jgi:hypothetical protein
VAPAALSTKKPTSSHAKVPPRKRAVADVHWSDAATDMLQAQQPARSELENGAALAEQPAKTLASIVDIDAFLASVHKRN